MTVPTRVELEELRLSYDNSVKAYLKAIGVDFVDMAISSPGAAYILSKLEDIRLRKEAIARSESPAARTHRDGSSVMMPGDVEKESGSSPTFMSVLDLGAGFSTVFINDWIGKNTGPLSKSELRLITDSFCCYVGVEHDRSWLTFMKSIALDQVIQRPGELVSRAVYEKRLDLTVNVPMSFRPIHICKFDAIVVDHGPHMDTRADDVPWILSRLKDDGILLFDDWRPKHEGRIRRALARAEPRTQFVIEAPSWVKRFRRDKTIGAVWRSTGKSN